MSSENSGTMQLLGPKATMQMTGKSKANYSYQHMESAIHQMMLARECESGNVGKKAGDGDFSNHHRSYVVGAVISTTMSAEAYINEFYLQAIDGSLKSIADERCMLMLTELWKIGERKFKTLDKYQLALRAIHKEVFETNEQCYQDMQLLIEFRNLLIHFKPEWDDKPIKSAKIEKKMRSKNFKTNPFWHDAAGPFFPFRCMSFDLAYWAVESGLMFVLKFCSLIGQDEKDSHSQIWKRHIDKMDEIKRDINQTC